MEVELDFPIAHSPDTFYQTSRLVVLLALADNIVEFGTRGNAEGRLIDGLVASVELRDDEMASRTEGQHTGSISIMIGPEPPKTGQESMVQIDDPTRGKLPASVRWQDSHVASQHHIIGLVQVDQLDHLGVVRRPVLISDELERDVVLACQQLALAPVPNNDNRIGIELSGMDRMQDRPRRVLQKCRADRKPRPLCVELRTPYADLEFLILGDRSHLLL